MTDTTPWRPASGLPAGAGHARVPGAPDSGPSRFPTDPGFAGRPADGPNRSAAPGGARYPRTATVSVAGRPAGAGDAPVPADPGFAVRARSAPSPGGPAQTPARREPRIPGSSPGAPGR